MVWSWQYLDADAALMDSQTTETFPSQSDAESWLGENWRELLAAGVMSVTLLEDKRTEYTMPLTAE
jgi:hypothetical protein